MKALVLCGGLPQLELINILKRRGFEVLLADMNPQAPAVKYADKFFPASTLDVEAIRQIAIAEEVDLILSVCADQMILVSSLISQELGLPTYITHETAVLVSDKELMKREFLKGNVPTSKFYVDERLEEMAVEGLKYPLVVKPTDAYSSKGITKIDMPKDLPEAFETAKRVARNGKVIIEEYVGGTEYTVDVYVQDGNAKVLCIGELSKIPVSGKFVINRVIYRPAMEQWLRDAIKDASQKIADVFRLENTPMLVQLKAENGRISVLEFCARTGGGNKYSLIKKMTGFDVIDAVVKLTLGEPVEVPFSTDTKYVVDEFVYCDSGTVSSINWLEDNCAIIDDSFLFKPEGAKFGEIRSSGDRLGYYSVSGSSAEEVLRKHAEADAQIAAYNSAGIDLIRHDFIELKEI